METKIWKKYFKYGKKKDMLFGITNCDMLETSITVTFESDRPREEVDMVK